MTAALLLGLLIDMRHALEADHLAAVAALVISSDSLRTSVVQGAAWGLGHTITLFAVGSFVVFSASVVPESTARFLEGCVGVMLVVLGIDVARRLVRERVHVHVHRHDEGTQHVHAHSHRNEPAQDHDPQSHHHAHRPQFPGRALFIGLMHGLAGSAALVILTLDTTDTVWQGLLYMALFGVGSIVGMAVLSAAIALPLCRTDTRLTWFHRGTQGLVSVVNVSIGVYLLYRAAEVPLQG
jgi:ABC-type nickel/cobalt efflux system permease component RcnA